MILSSEYIILCRLAAKLFFGGDNAIIENDKTQKHSVQVRRGLEMKKLLVIMLAVLVLTACDGKADTPNASAMYTVEPTEVYINSAMGFSAVIFSYDFTNNSSASLAEIPLEWRAEQGGIALELGSSQTLEGEIVAGATIKSGVMFMLENDTDDIVIVADAEDAELYTVTYKLAELDHRTPEVSTLNALDEYTMLGDTIPSITSVVGMRDLTGKATQSGDDYEVNDYIYVSDTPYDDVLEYGRYLIENCNFIAVGEDGTAESGKCALVAESSDEDIILRVQIDWTPDGYTVSAGKVHNRYFQ